MDYLYGQPIQQSAESKRFIQKLENNPVKAFETPSRTTLGVDTKNWSISFGMLTNEPLPAAEETKTQPTTWNWRFKTEQELIDEFGKTWRGAWGIAERDYLFGEPLPNTPEAIAFMNKIMQGENVIADTSDLFSISSTIQTKIPKKNEWTFDKNVFTDKPLPAATVSTQSKPNTEAPKKRGRKPKSPLPDIDLGGLDDIGDINIDDIDFDNLVI
jgi:hypothetical protein